MAARIVAVRLAVGVAAVREAPKLSRPPNHLGLGMTTYPIIMLTQSVSEIYSSRAEMIAFLLLERSHFTPREV